MKREEKRRLLQAALTGLCSLQAIVQYKHSGGEYAEVVWCQEEPKNQVQL